MDKSMFKMKKDDLEQYIGAMKKCACMKKKKGTGSYTRKEKHKNKIYD